MLAYVIQTAVVIKTQLEVQDNRLCNAVTLSDLPDSDEVSLPCAGKVWPNNLDETIIASLLIINKNNKSLSEYTNESDGCA